MLPLTFLSAMLCLCALAVLVNMLVRRQLGQALKRLGGEWGMRYTETDVFGLAPRVAQRFPVPGASDLRVVDLLYRIEGDRHRYLFTTEYTQGVIRTKHRLRCVVTFTEPRDPIGAEAAASSSALVLAAEELPLVEQYMQLADREVLGGARAGETSIVS
jgi:hypothetical protein